MTWHIEQETQEEVIGLQQISAVFFISPKDNRYILVCVFSLPRVL